MNVYLIEDDGGLTLFDAGISDMTVALAARRRAARRDQADRARPRRRRSPRRRAGTRRAGLLPSGRARGGRVARAAPALLGPRRSSDRRPPAAGEAAARWDGGAVEIAGTVQEGDEIAGFRVVDLPGHAPGLIGLFRESDRLALVSD